MLIVCSFVLVRPCCLTLVSIIKLPFDIYIHITFQLSTLQLQMHTILCSSINSLCQAKARRSANKPCLKTCILKLT